jgi:surface antigen
VGLRFTALGVWGLLLISCLPAMASSGGNCVAYAREMTGVHLDGNAASWWPHAEGRYERGHQPLVGAVLVFKPYGRMHVGHVAVVSQVVGPREILVDQANWVRGRVTKAMSVVDASPLNDWTSVKVQFAGTHGRENPTYGFIYPRVQSASSGETIVEPQPALQSHAAPTARNIAKATPDKHKHEAQQANAKAQDKGGLDHKQLAKAGTATAKPQDKSRHDHKQLARADTTKTQQKEPIAEPAADKSPPHLAENAPTHDEKTPDASLAYVY